MRACECECEYGSKYVNMRVCVYVRVCAELVYTAGPCYQGLLAVGV